MDPEQIILDEDFDDGSTDGGYGEYDYLQQDKDALPVTPLVADINFAHVLLCYQILQNLVEAHRSL